MASTKRKPGASVSRRSNASTEPVHLHIDNPGDLGEVFQVTRKRLREALARHPEVAARLRVTMDSNGRNLARHLQTADVLFGWDFDRATVRAAPCLRWVVAHGAGVSHLMPLDWLPDGAVLTNSSGVHGERAAEYCIMALLMLNNRLPEMFTNQRRAHWEQTYNTVITGKTVLIIGVGAVGGGAARHARHFGLHVLGIRRSGRAHPHVHHMHQPKDLRRLLPKADFVLMCAPDTVDSHQMLGDREIGLMKSGAGLVNYSRAGLIDYDAVRVACTAGRISAILDVHEREPLPRSSPSWKTPNLVVTPHCSSDDAELYTPKTLDLLLQNMARFMAGRKLRNVVDPVHQY